MPAAKMRSIKRPRMYEALRRRGMAKSSAARIANTPKAKRTARK